MSMCLKIGDWVQHRVNGRSERLCIICMNKDFVFFHDFTHARRTGDMSWLVPCGAPEQVR
jgi:hypothetical protein